MIKVLHCPSVMETGGIQTMLMRLYRDIDRKEFPFDFLIWGGDQRYEFEYEIEELGGQIFRVPKRSENLLKHYTEIMRLLRHSDYDIVHIHTSNAVLTALEVVVMRLAGAKNIIVHSHNTSDDRVNRYKFLLPWAQRYLLKHSINFACGKAAARWLYGTDENIHVMPLPIMSREFLFQPEEREQLRAEMGLQDNLIVTNVGRFVYQKNHPFLVDILRELVKRQPKVKLFLLGDGPDRADIEARFREAGLMDYVVFWGTDTQVYKRLNISDVFLLPSHFEGLPTVALEAQASGLPCLISDAVTDEIGITDLVHFLSLKEGAAVWAEQVLSLAETDQSRRSSYNAAIAETYDIDSVTHWLEQQYHSLTGK